MQPSSSFLNGVPELLVLSVLAMASLIFAFVGFVNAKPAVGAGAATIDPVIEYGRKDGSSITK